MEQKKIERINELARKAKTPQGLTPEETEERAALRQEYLNSIMGNLRRPGTARRRSWSPSYPPRSGTG